MEQLPVHEQERLSSWAILILVLLLLALFFASYVLNRLRVRVLHESLVAIVLGMLAGGLLRMLEKNDIKKIVAFDHRYFFNLLLPPVILHSGYDIDLRYFLANIGSVLLFAVVGTVFSALVIGLLLFLFVATGWHSLRIGLMECVMFGAILSSTDPVSVLAIFSQLSVDPKLYAIVFGESMLNDAVSIVLYSTLNRFKDTSVTFGNFMFGIASFLWTFIGSWIVGMAVALGTALLLKYSNLYTMPIKESCIVLLLAYSSYILANAVELSGIVSLLFCGMAMRRYMFDNLSLQSQRTTKYMLKVMAQLSENFIFIYLGLTLFTERNEVFRWGFILFTFLFILVGRAAGVFPLAQLINWNHVRKQKRRQSQWLNLEETSPRNEQSSMLPVLAVNTRNSSSSLPRSSSVSSLSNLQDSLPLSHSSTSQQSNLAISFPYQIMIWWSGLRGAIAFALSMDIETANKREIRTTTLVVVVLSIIILGGTTPLMIKYLGIPTGIASSSSNDSEDGQSEYDETAPNSPSIQDQAQEMQEQRERMELEMQEHKRTHWFMSFDDKYIRPVFTRPRPGWKRSRSGLGGEN